MFEKRLVISSVLFFILFSCSFVSLVGASSVMWNQTYGGTESEAAWVVIEVSSGGFALAGNTESFGAGFQDFWLIKTDENGVVEWNQTYGGAGFEDADSLVQTSDGGYALAGHTQSFGEKNGDFWLVKTDPDGNILWNQTYGNGADERAYGLVESSDGGFVLVGDISYSDGDGDGGWSDIWLVKTDENGNAEWNQTYGGPDIDRPYGGLVAVSDGGYAIAGFTQSFGAGDYDFWLIKTDAKGNMQWNQTYGEAFREHAYALIESSSGGFVLAGTERDSALEPTNLWLVKTDENGNMEWNQSIGLNYDRVWALVEAPDAGYAAAGRTQSFDNEGYDVWLVKTDEQGNMQWNQTYGGTGYEEAYSLIAASDGGYVLAGYTSSFGVGKNDVWLIKTDEMGIPEFSSWIIVPLMLAMFSIIVVYKKKTKLVN